MSDTGAVQERSDVPSRLATTAPPVRPRARRRIGSGAARLLRRVAGVVIFVLIMQVLSVWGPSQWRIPSLDTFVAGVVALVTAPTFLTAVAETVIAVLIAVALATALAIVVGIVFGTSRFIEIAFALPFELLRPIPAFAVIPLAIIALGSGQPMEVAVGVFAGWWPLLFNTIYGVRQVDRQAVDAARVMGCGRLQIAYRVVLPSLLPFLFAGLRVAMPIVLVVVIGAEYLSTAQRGLGGVLIVATSGGQLSVLWSTAAVAGVLGILLGGVVALAGRWAAPWAEERAR